ncbi:hypothetical protein AYX22_22650 (plasmid) [Arthrobacter sp. D5-1]|nr:hypothetical protein AYX22_22650 [Arthrobacter sp. D5-1]
MVIALSAPALLLLSACSGGGSGAGARQVEVGDPLTRAVSSAGGDGYFPGFRPVSTVSVDSAPQGSGSAFTGSVFPAAGRENLSFYGFNSSGTRWRIDTNPSCVGTVLTSVNGEPSIVILDSDARTDGKGPVSVTVATAFAVDDGETLWGPTEVPGPSTGGLIFANTPKGLTAEKAPGTVLDADTGAVVDLNARPGTALYEHHGTVLLGDGPALTAIDAGSGRLLWSSSDLRRPPAADPEAHVVFRGSYGPSSGGVVVLEWTAGGDSSVPVVYDLQTGKELAQASGTPAGIARVDGATGTVLFTARQASGDHVLQAVRPGTGLLWSKAAKDAEVFAAGHGAVYARLDGTSARMDLESGAVLESGQFVLPEAVLADGSALFPTRESSTGYVLAKPEP